MSFGKHLLNVFMKSQFGVHTLLADVVFYFCIVFVDNVLAFCVADSLVLLDLVAGVGAGSSLLLFFF